MSDKLSCN